MEVTLNQVKDSARSFPIALYTGRKIKMRVSEKARTSYYKPMTDSITISYPQISTSLKFANNEAEKETSIRSMLYHETSHAILTTPNTSYYSDVFNVMEDERIETVLNDYYCDVDFSNQVYTINGITSNDEVGEPLSGFQAFYSAVRFHKGREEHIKAVENLIKKYAKLTREDNSSWYYYTEETKKLYETICNDYGFPIDESKEYGKNGDDDDDDNDGTSNSDNGSTGNGNEENENLNKVEASSEGEGEKKVPFSAVGDGNENKKHEMSVAVAGNCPLNKGIKPLYDSKVYDKLTAILMNFTKRNNGGSSVCAYSGSFNPRNVIRKDYKYFDRKVSINGMNRYGSMHLNLFLDNSGSFSYDAPIVNSLLGALIKLEENNDNFTFSVVHCAVGEELITNKDEYGLECDGGTSLDYNAINLYKKLQKPSTFNYNIVLYDGSCLSSRYPDAFKAFNYNNCTIISDPSNQAEIVQYAPQARHIITNSYTENLLNNVFTALEQAFR